MKDLLLLFVITALFMLNTSFVLNYANNDKEVEVIKVFGLKCYAAVPTKDGGLHEATCWVCDCAKLYETTKRQAEQGEEISSKKKRKQRAKCSN